MEGKARKRLLKPVRTNVGDSSDPRRTPHSRKVPETPEEACRYGSIPAEDVEFARTALAAVLKQIDDPDPIVAAELADYWNHRLLAKVREAEKALRDAYGRMDTRNTLAAGANKPVLVRIEKWETTKDELLRKRVQQLENLSKSRADGLLKCAGTHAGTRLKFDPSSPVPSVPNEERLTPPNSHASELKLPYSTEENGVFLSSDGETTVSAIVGVASGISVMAAAGVLHLGAISRELPLAGVAAGLGIALTMLAGKAMKAAWRTASEAYYLGKGCVNEVKTALAVTLPIIAIETVVDMRGLMAASLIHEQVQSTGTGAIQPTGPGIVTLVLLGGLLSYLYAAYMGFSGWRGDRQAATNRIIQSQEEERLARLKDILGTTELTEALAAGNQVLALDAITKDAIEVYDQQLKLIDARLATLKSGLHAITDQLSVDEIAIIDKAITEAEGAQIEWDLRVKALRDGRVYTPRYKSVAVPNRVGFWAKVRAFFSRRARARGGV